MTAISSLCAASACWYRGEGVNDAKNVLCHVSLEKANQCFMIDAQASD